MKTLRCLALVLALFAVVGSAHAAQQAAATNFSLEGTWYGLVSDYPFTDSPKRVLLVRATPDKYECFWGLTAETLTKSACSVEGDTLKLTTRPGSKVTLSLGGGRLQGNFIPPDGSSSLVVAMGREPVRSDKFEVSFPGVAVARPPSPSALRGDLDGKTCKGSISNVGRAYYGHTNSITFTFKDGRVVVEFGGSFKPYSPFEYTHTAGGYQFKIWGSIVWLWKMFPRSDGGYDLEGTNLSITDLPTFGRVKC